MRDRESMGEILEGLKHINEGVLNQYGLLLKSLNRGVDNSNIMSGTLLNLVTGSEKKVIVIYKEFYDSLTKLCKMSANDKGINSMIRDVNNNFEEFKKVFKDDERLKDYPDVKEFIDTGFEDLVSDESYGVGDASMDLLKLIDITKGLGGELFKLVTSSNSSDIKYLLFKNRVSELGTILSNGLDTDDVVKRLKDSAGKLIDWIEKTDTKRKKGHIVTAIREIMDKI